jgi:hypothetical protein
MNSSAFTTEKCLLNSVENIFNRYIENKINIFGLIANGLCTVIFYKIIKRPQQQSNVFKYLFMKSMTDFLIYVSNRLECLYYCRKCRTTSSYLIQIWYI